jgi:hypothetical protein
MITDKSIAFLDIDSLEYSSDRNVRESEIPHLSFRERVMPIASLLNSIYSYASRNNHPFVFSTCCSARTPSIEEMPHVLHIPAQINDSSWKNRLDDHSMFFIEKAITDHTQSDFLNKMYEKFKQNQNLATFIDTLGVHEWVVFGNGAAFCVYPALMCLIDSGQKVTILSDVLIDSAPGYATQTPSELRLKMLDDCASRGASVCTLKTFWKSKDLEFYSKAGSLPILVEEECL